MRFTYCTILIFFTLRVFGQTPATEIKRLKTATDREKPALCLSLSRYYAQAQPDSAVNYANLGIRAAEAMHDDRSLAELLLQSGDINRLHHHQELARGFYNEALGIFRHLKDDRGLAQAYDALGILDDDNADFKLAMQYEQDSRGSGDVIATYTAMGKAAEEKGETDKAISHYLRALAQYEQRGQYPQTYFSLLQSIGKLYALKGNTRIALHYLQEGIRDSLQQGAPDEASRFMDAEGEAFEESRDEKDALRAYKQALDNAKRDGQPDEQAEALLHIANVLKTSDSYSSIADLKEALRIARKIAQPDLEAKIYAALSSAYRQQKNYGSALFALEEQHRLLDSLLAADTIKDIRALDTSYALERSHEKVTSLQTTNREEGWLIASGIVILLVIVGLLILLWRSLSKVKALNTELEASNRIKDTLFSVIGHDLKGPAASALQLFELLEAGDISEKEMKELIGDLRRQTNASLDLLQALFEWGRAQLQGIQVNPVDFQASEVVERCIRLLAGQAADKQLQLHAIVATDIKIHADANHFAFVIRNLIANAIKFSYPGGEIDVAAEQRKDSNEVIFSVLDHGVGISNEQVSRFQTTNLKVNFGTQKEKGSGLGLLLAKDFVRANGGRIWLKSTEGKGTTFFIALPASQY